MDCKIQLDYFSFDMLDKGTAIFDLIEKSGNRVTGSLSQPNNLADLLCWGLFANIYRYNHNKFISKLILIANLIIISFFISLTYSRTPILFAIFMILYGLILINKTKQYSILLILHGCILLSVIFTISNSYQYKSNLEQIIFSSTKVINQHNLTILAKLPQKARSAEEKSASDNQRLILWQRGWQMFLDHPTVGVGWQYFGSNLLKIKSSKTGEGFPQFTLFMNAHNLFIHLLATTGIIGFLIVLIFISYTLYKSWLRPQPQQILILGISNVMLLHSMVEYPLFYLSFLYCFIILITIADDKKIILINSKYTIRLIFIFIICVSWQIFSGVNNFLILSQLKRPTNYLPSDPLHNIMIKYNLGLNPLWSYYVDADFAYKINIDNINTSNKPFVNLEYEIIKKVERFSPYPIYILKLAIIEDLKLKSNNSKLLIEELTYNYPEFKSEIRSWIIKVTSTNRDLQNRMLNYLH